MDNTKQCTKCGETKPLSEFYKRKASKDGLASRCKECVAKYGKAWYKNNKEHCAAVSKAYHEANGEQEADRSRIWYKVNKEHCAATRKTRRDRRRAILDRYKQIKGCVCLEEHPLGVERRPACLVFHHLFGEDKKGGVSQMVSRVSWQDIKAEVAKCVVVCRNCHALIHNGDEV